MILNISLSQIIPGDLMQWFADLKNKDPEVYGLIREELERKRVGLEMIPSENFTSMAVMQAMGSILTDKYSEGYPGRRYYGGNQVIDKVERTAVARAKEAFGVPYVNVQPYSGSPANLEVYFAVCKIGETIMGLDLPDGGHLTHGSKGSVTGQIFKSVPYHTRREDGRIDFEEVRRLIQENKPRLIWVGYTAYPREFPFEEFAKIVEGSDAYLAADISHISGLVLGGAHNSPVPYVHIVTSTTHKTLRGPRGAMIMVTEKGLKKDPDLGKKIDNIVIPGMQGGPHNHTTAAIAVALLEASKPDFKQYAAQVVKNAKTLAEELKKNGIKLVSDGTDTHLILVDLTPFGEGFGLFAQDALDEAGITVNKNAIPGEPFSLFYPSGVRMGTPAITTRGMKEAEMVLIARYIADAINAVKDYRMPKDKEERSVYIKRFAEELKSNPRLAEIRKQVMALCSRFPLYPELEM